MDLGIANRTCIVTGAGRGIGRRTAEMLAAEGARVLAVARTAEQVEEVAAATGGAALACDVTDPGAPQAMLDATRKAFDAEPDALVNNAGVAKWRQLEDVPDEDWQAAWDLNVMAPMRAMRALIPGMVERGWGRVVNVSSTAGKRPSKHMPEYSVAKAAELSLSRLFADRHAGDGVLVNAICPGPTKSEMWMAEGGLADQSKELSGAESKERALEQAGGGRPIGRFAEVDEIANAIVFLCSERASYVAGAAWSIDGGAVAVIV